MSKTSTITYEGELRTRAVHLQSLSELITDAPVDNHGKGEAFSPTDLVATALVSCMMTIIGIQATKSDLPIGSMKGQVEKIMVSDPRRISILRIVLAFEGHDLDEAQKKRVETLAMNCPVAKSIHPDITLNVSFKYG